MKNTGSYYTPSILSDYIARHVQAHFKGRQGISILEPSSGDGAFIKSIQKSRAKGDSFSMDAVDLNQVALEQSAECLIQNPELKKCIKFFNQDFLDFVGSTRKKYDIVIGNPPYISRTRIHPEQKVKALSIHKESGLETTSIHNIWTAFVIGGASLLNDGGVMAYVLPTEVLQVNYAEEVRAFLQKNFDRIEIITAQSLLFNDIEQDVVILIAYKTCNDKGLYFSVVHDLSELSLNQVCLKKNVHLQVNQSKWTNHVLSDYEMELMYKVANRLRNVRDYCTSSAGIVTAANDYFIIDDASVNKYGLQNVSKPILQKGAYVNGGLTFDKEALEKLKGSGKPCNLLCFDKDQLESSEYARFFPYFNKGIKDEVWSRYKCQKRSHWLTVPSVWKSSGLFFKRSHEYPKLIRNDADILVTDTAYRVSPSDGYTMEGLIYSFYNSFTMAFSEMNGRYYGGGVLELTPNEFKDLPIPYVDITSDDFDKFALDFKNKDNVESILLQQDQIILSKKLGLSYEEITSIQLIKKKLKDRRLR